MRRTSECILELTVLDWATINRKISLCKRLSNPEDRLELSFMSLLGNG